MIKLNLLPSHLAEIRRMKVAVVVFVFLLLLEGGLIFAIQLNLKAREAWFTRDTQRCNTRAEEMKKYAAAADELGTKASAYDAWIAAFGTLQPTKTANEQIALSLIEAGQKLGNGGAFFTQLNITADGTLTGVGDLKGSMKFLSYYFRLKDAGFTLKPAVQPAKDDSPTVTRKTLNQEVVVEVSGKVTKLPDVPAFPDAGVGAESLYKPVTGGADGAAAGQPGQGAGGAPGGMPADAGYDPYAMPNGAVYVGPR